MIDIDSLMQQPLKLTDGKSYKQVLIETRNLLSAPEHWTQEAYARADGGHVVRPRDPRAICWCMLGGIARTCNVHGIIPPPLLTFLEDMVNLQFGKDTFAGPGAMNDYVSHPVMLNFLDVTISQFPQETP